MRKFCGQSFRTQYGSIYKKIDDYAASSDPIMPTPEEKQVMRIRSSASDYRDQVFFNANNANNSTKSIVHPVKNLSEFNTPCGR